MELTKILEKERLAKERLEQIKDSSQKEIQKKQEELALLLAKEGNLKEAKKKELLVKKQAAVEQIEKTAEKDLAKKISELEKKQSQNQTEAVDYVLKELLKSA